MKIDKLIKDLNKKITSLGIGLDKLDHKDLTEREYYFLEKYNPVQSLIIYGTLAPGRPNHSKIEHIKGKWAKGIIKGKLENKGWGAELGFYGFSHCPIEEQEKIAAHILFSDKLAENWSLLDTFEGDEYQRILCKFELENGEIGLGNIYAIKAYFFLFLSQLKINKNPCTILSPFALSSYQI
jgi:gamma-glutamylcyclotransferase (GGCT)/AIG2-like uncharacterized protein YtfP